MPKQVILIMKDNYPFGQSQECTNDITKVMVRKIYHLTIQQKNRLLQKVRILRKLKNQHMIRIQSVLEEEQNIHFLFQYIPIKLETWISNINEQFIQSFMDQLIKFSSFLANHCIRTQFQLKNIGMDQDYKAKYFLDLNFRVDGKVNRKQLKSQYIREITSLFNPYIINSNLSKCPNSYKPLNNSNAVTNEISTNEPETHQQIDYSISPPTNNIQKYDQDVNIYDNQNQSILQEFMDVLENGEPTTVKNRQSTSPNSFLYQSIISQVKGSFDRQNTINNLSYQSGFQYHQNSVQNQEYNYSKQKLLSFQQNHQFKRKLQGLVNKRNSRQINSLQATERGRYESKGYKGKQSSSIDIKNRVKFAIEKSLNAIKRFKSIKDFSIL